MKTIASVITRRNLVGGPLAAVRAQTHAHVIQPPAKRSGDRRRRCCRPARRSPCCPATPASRRRTRSA